MSKRIPISKAGIALGIWNIMNSQDPAPTRLSDSDPLIIYQQKQNNKIFSKQDEIGKIVHWEVGRTMLLTIRGGENEKNIIHLGLENIIIATLVRYSDSVCTIHTQQNSANISWLNSARNNLLTIYFSYVDKQLCDVSIHRYQLLYPSIRLAGNQMSINTNIKVCRYTYKYRE